jgi:hypothetical protein
LNFGDPLASWGPWRNINSDPNVRWLLDGKNKEFDPEKVKKYTGAYMTDLIKNVTGTTAAKVKEELEPENINKNIGWFFEEIDLLGSDCIEMYLFGTDVNTLFTEYVERHADFPEFRKKVKKCQHIFHYSGNNNGRFRNYAPEELGLRNSSTPKIRMRWNDLE